MTKKDILLRGFSKKVPKTVNQVIDKIYQKDLKTQTNRGWKFYLQLNKLPAPLLREGLLVDVGSTEGKHGPEKLWLRT